MEIADIKMPALVHTHLGRAFAEWCLARTAVAALEADGSAKLLAKELEEKGGG